MTDGGFRIVGSEHIASVAFIALEQVHVVAPDGSALTRATVRHPGAVAVVPVIDGSVILIRQYRAPVDTTMLELPAGKLDVDGEPPEETARRELAEEVGYAPGRLELMATFFTTPGFTDEKMWLYLATDLQPAVAAPHGPEEMAAEVVRVPIGELPGLIDSGEIVDGKTLVGLSLLLSREG